MKLSALWLLSLSDIGLLMCRAHTHGHHMPCLCLSMICVHRSGQNCQQRMSLSSVKFTYMQSVLLPNFSYNSLTQLLQSWTNMFLLNQEIYKANFKNLCTERNSVMVLLFREQSYLFDANSVRPHQI